MYWTKFSGKSKKYGKVLVKPDVILGGVLKGKRIIGKVKWIKYMYFPNNIEIFAAVTIQNYMEIDIF